MDDRTPTVEYEEECFNCGLPHFKCACLDWDGGPLDDGCCDREHCQIVGQHDRSDCCFEGQAERLDAGGTDA